MQQAAVPAPQVMLAGAIVFLLAGGVSVLLGFKGRWGAALLAIFLVLATYYIHDFWTIADAQARQAEMNQFMKNASLLGELPSVTGDGAGMRAIGDNCTTVERLSSIVRCIARYSCPLRPSNRQPTPLTTPAP